MNVIAVFTVTVFAIALLRVARAKYPLIALSAGMLFKASQSGGVARMEVA